MQSEYISLLVASVIAFLMPYIARRANIPVIVGEISLGVAVGLLSVGLHWATGTTFLSFEKGSPVYFLSEIGFIFLLFLVGLEIDFNMVKEKGIQHLTVSVAMFTTALFLSYLAARAIGLDSPLFMALVLSTTSLGVVMPLMREMGISKSHWGQDIILAAVIADIGAMVLLPAAIGLESGGSLYVGALIVVIVALTFVALYFLGSFIMWRWPAPLARFFRSDDPHETGVRASFLLIMVFVVLSQAIGTEAILGAFLAGAAISFMFRGSGVLESKLFGFGYGFLIPLFFVRVGVQFSDYVTGPGGLSGLWLVPVMVGVAFLIKVLPTLYQAPEHGVRASLAAGVLLSGGLSLAIAAAEIGLSRGVISQSESTAIIFFAIVMAILSPLAFRRMHAAMAPRPQEVEPIHIVTMPGDNTKAGREAGRKDDSGAWEDGGADQ